LPDESWQVNIEERHMTCDLSSSLPKLLIDVISSFNVLKPCLAMANLSAEMTITSSRNGFAKPLSKFLSLLIMNWKKAS
jgi:hypothetical protein